MTKTHAASRPHSDRYFDLVHKFPLRPIRTDAEVDQAVAMIDSLIDREQLEPDEQDYLDVLADQVEKYESEQHPLPAVSEADILRHLIEARDITQLKLGLHRHRRVHDLEHLVGQAWHESKAHQGTGRLFQGQPGSLHLLTAGPALQFRSITRPRTGRLGSFATPRSASVASPA